MIDIKIKKLVKEAQIPQYAHKGFDAGLDLVAVSKTIDQTHDYGFIEFGTGLAIEIPEGYVGLLFPRSSISKTGMILANSVGVVDCGYSGEVKLRFKYIATTKSYEVGDKVGQLVVLPYPQVNFIEADELSDSVRQDKGFGSSGK